MLKVSRVEMKTKTNFPFFAVALAVYALVFLPWLLTRGCFGDGLMYASIAQQLEQGNGSLYQLFFSEHAYHNFYGHPPLGIWIMRAMMSFIGEGFWFERVFSLVTLTGTMTVMYLFWRRLAPDLSRDSFGLVMLLWILIPVNSWSYSNNMLENTLTFFCLVSLFIYWVSVEQRNILFSLVSGVFFCLAIMTKGPVALFVFPACIFIDVYHKSRWQSIMARSITSIIGCIATTLVFLWPSGATLYFDQYLTIQVLDAISSEIIGNRFSIFTFAFFELILIGCVYLIFKVLGLTDKWSRKSILMLLVFLMASVPIVLSTKQMRYYLVPSLPYLVLCISLLFQPILKVSFPRVKMVQFVSISLILFGIISMVVFKGQSSRDEMIIKDIMAIDQSLSGQTFIKWQGEPPPWNVVCYFSRYAGLVLSNDKKYPVQYWLTDKENPSFRCTESNTIDIDLGNWILCKK